MTQSLEGRVVVITGSGRGQGFAAAKLFAEAGARVVVNDLDDASVEAAVETIRAAGGEAVGATADVSSSEDVQSMLRTAASAFGGIDVLYNNAGIGYSATQRMAWGWRTSSRRPRMTGAA